MATSFKKATIPTYPRVGEKVTRDTTYWKNLEFPVRRKEYGGISHIDFCPTPPYHYAVTSGSKVQIFSCDDNQVVKSFSRFSDGAKCGSLRSDGKLLVSGSGEGNIRLFEVSNKALLRVFKGHHRPVAVTKFLSDNIRLLSGSDDQSVRIWDIAAESEIVTYNEHQDYVRCGVTSKASKDLVLTGSYDHTVRLFDARSPTSSLTVDHGQPVESVLMFPGGGIFLSAGGPVIKVWDALAGGKLLTSFSNHHKTITSLCFCSNYQRLVSTSLDRHVKIYDVGTYQLVHTLDYPSAILSVGISPDDKVVAVGMADGLLSVQHRKPSTDQDTDPELRRRRREKKASFHYKVTATSYTPSKEDLVIEHKRKEQLAKYDKYFKSFSYSKALDAALDIRVRMTRPQITVGVMQELIRRGGIISALAGRDERSLSSIVKFLQKNISVAALTPTLLDVANMMIDIYGSELVESAAVAELMLQLKDTIDSEANYMKTMMEIMGSMDTLLTAAEISSTTDQNGHVQSDADLKPSLSATAAGS